MFGYSPSTCSQIYCVFARQEQIAAACVQRIRHDFKTRTKLSDISNDSGKSESSRLKMLKLKDKKLHYIIEAGGSIPNQYLFDSVLKGYPVHVKSKKNT